MYDGYTALNVSVIYFTMYSVPLFISDSIFQTPGLKPLQIKNGKWDIYDDYDDKNDEDVYAVGKVHATIVIPPNYAKIHSNKCRLFSGTL